MINAFKNETPVDIYIKDEIGNERFYKAILVTEISDENLTFSGYPFERRNKANRNKVLTTEAFSRVVNVK